MSALSLLLLSCSNTAVSSSETIQVETSSDTLFTEIFDVIPFEDLNRRKFDAPVIADLDQDGKSDLIVNQHGLGMKVFWNDGETFFQGPIIMRGDVHGATVSDFNNNGNLDIIITQGGGDGGNPRRPVWVEVNTSREFTKPKAFSYFEPGRGRAVNFLTDPSTGNLNLLVTGFPMPSQTEGANHLYKYSGGDTFEFVENLPQAKWLGYRPSLTDFNLDGLEDLIFYGGKDMVAVERGKDGAFTEKTESVFGKLHNTNDVASITEIDFDNDGDQDLFLTRAEHQFDIESYYDPDSRRFAFLSFRKDYIFDDILVDGNLVIENLQRTYPHRDVFLGAQKTPYKFNGDPHGHQDIKIKVEDALGWPEGETTGGMYIGYIGDGYWRIAGQSRSRTAAVVLNVDSAPEIVPQPNLPAKLFENKNGVFVDVTELQGIKISDQTTGATTADFNNDGWLDLAVLRYGSMAAQNEHLILFNQGGTGFKQTENHGLKAIEFGSTGGFMQAFDQNEDGVMDLIYANERGQWHLMRNTIPIAFENNHVVIDVSQIKSNRAALGAIVTVSACDQRLSRKVGATSAAFSQNYDLKLHFGLGQCAKVDQVTIKWPDGSQEDVTAVFVK